MHELITNLTVCRKDAVICMLARDCADQLEKNIDGVERLQHYFNVCSIIVVENDSIDGTKEMLENWRVRNGNLKIINSDGLFKNSERSGSSFDRINRMSYFRNLYLNEIKEIKSNPDFLIVIDIDIFEFDPETIISAVNNAPDDWGALFANGIVKNSFLFFKMDLYYDIFALDTTGTDINRTFYDGCVKNIHIEKEIRKRQFYRVFSAFGGIGIYKYNLIKDMEYSAIPNNKSTLLQCNAEHVSINYSLCNNGYKLYIVRDMPVIYFYGKSIRSFIKYLCPKLILQLFYKIFLHIKE
ncbi:hypothetical protein AGMMS49928_15630 [Spirochaetia bacterium]|nr:hypothetical protein AGMMS49928_15630 [Spirochaetia bacterium]